MGQTMRPRLKREANEKTVNYSEALDVTATCSSPKSGTWSELSDGGISTISWPYSLSSLLPSYCLSSMGSSVTCRMHRLPFHIVFILLLVPLHISCGTSDVTNSTTDIRPVPSYSWKTEIWGACYSTSGCGDGHKSRTVICADRDGLRMSHVNCLGQKKPKSKQPCFKVCQKYIKFVSWRVSEWDKCKPNLRRSKQPCVGQLQGTRSRTVQCVFQKNNYYRILDNIQCARTVKPLTKVVCVVPCPQNCIVTKFSDWMSCDGRCGMVANKTRTRTVLVAPKYGGNKCPKLIEMTDCDEARAACLQSPFYKAENKLRIGSWGACTSTDSSNTLTSSGFFSQKPSVGFQTRSIECRNSYGTTLDIGECKAPNKDMATERSCIVQSDCQMSSWSKWNIVRPGCQSSDGKTIEIEVRVRSRIIIKLPVGNGKRCPFATERHVISAPNLLKNCNQYKWIASEWSACTVIIQRGQQAERKVATCSGGLLQRNVTCVQTNEMKPVAAHLCINPRLSTIKPCNVTCKQDCEVSNWSEWGPCRPPKSSIINAFNIPSTGYKLRQRYITKQSLSGGKRCPPLKEVEICEHPSWYRFDVGDWGECQINRAHQTCGPGTQQRAIRCLTLSGKTTTDELCKFFLPSPVVSRSCHVPCAGDCVLSEWSNWSSCSALCFKDGSSNGIRSRNRTIISYASPEPNKHKCPGKGKLKEEETCNNHNCYGNHWQVKPWRQCKPINRTESCVLGKQKRQVHCFRKGKIGLLDKKCAPVLKPDNYRKCNYTCPRNCLVTKFSDWSLCPKECPKNLKTIPFKSRQRFVIHWPKNGGAPCPKVLEEQQNCSIAHCFEDNNGYEWRLGNWSKCEAKPCLKNFRTRAVTCLRINGGKSEEVEPHFCVKRGDGLPKMSEECSATCNKPKPCYLTSWSSWSGCNKNCGGNITRTRSLIQGSHKIAYCKDYHLQEKSKITCPRTLEVSFPKNEWSSCIADEKEHIAVVNGYPILGRCWVGSLYKKGYAIGKQTCQQTGIVTDLCIKDCPFDCKMAAWTEWSACSVHCGLGFRKRKRSLIAENAGGGRLCPTLTRKNRATIFEAQTDVCVRTCTENKWQALGWSQCKNSSSNKDAICGFGYQTQTVRCLKIIKGNLPTVVEDHFCDPILRPNSKRRCEVPCPDKCVVNGWSSWSSCPHPCSSTNKRRRQRKILRQANQSHVASLSCPRLVQEEPCVLGNNCFTYSWKVTSWSSCILPEGALCGQGHLRRGLGCIRNDGRIVDESNCLKLGFSRPSGMETWCFVDCPIDCEVSQWSSWNRKECSKCGTQAGYMIRSRQILQLNSSTGQKCPEDLVQRMPCPFKPCFFVEKTSWSSCSLKESECGYGSRSRNITCKRSDGHVVNIVNCLTANITDDISSILDPEWLIEVKGFQENEKCFVPCPGDCVLSEWSPWSHCHRNCENGEEVGFQTKSRAILAYPKNNGEPCPDELYETKPCIGGPCATFNWKVISKRIVCSSSDNVLVIGGCENKPLPCVPKCAVLNSMCTATGRCVCRAGYKATYQEQNNIVDDQSPNKSHKRSPNSTFILVACRPLFRHNGTIGGLPGNMSSEYGDINVKFYPDENEFSFWMYGMIAIGTAFLIFVSVTVYLMCHSKIREQFEFVHGRIRRRAMTPPPTAPTSTGSYSKTGNNWQHPMDTNLHRQHPNYLGVHKMDVD